jgi:hypothetical protein
MATNSNDGSPKSRDYKAPYNDSTAYDISSLLSTVQELNFESSGDGKRSGFINSEEEDEQHDEVW